MPTQIHFGTSGWRAVVADEFTLPNIRRAIVGIARYVSRQPGTHRILVGRDPRFMGEMFVAEAARLLAEGGVTPEVIGEAAPTAGLSQTSTVSAGKNWSATRLVAPKARR